MSDYKRLVAYIYLYRGENRSKNVGFTKVESRDGECRIQIQIKGAWAAEGMDCRAYIFYRAGEDIRGIPLGELHLRGGEGGLRVTTESDNISGSGMELADMAGILLLSAKEDIFATRWDDGPVRFSRFQVHGQTPAAQGKPEVRAAEKPAPAGKPDSPQGGEPSIRHAEGQEAEQAGSPEAAMAGQTLAAGGTQQQEIGPAQADSPGRDCWNKMLRSRERQTPFGKEDGDLYVYGEPRDLLGLGPKMRPLVNNSFLLHGFYSYGHLLLGRRAADGALLLGVPGEFYMQEKMMASLFGFPEFRKLTDGYGEGGNLGYWLRSLDR